MRNQMKDRRAPGSNPLASCGRRSLLGLAGLLGAAALALIAAQPTPAQTGGIHITSGPTVGRISATKATVTWTTDKAKAGQVKWGGKKGSYTSSLSESAATTSHSVTLTGLSRKTTYHFKVKTGGAKSADGTFTTADYDDSPFIFADMGDNRGESDRDDMANVTPSFQAILDAAVAKRPAFTIHVGDTFFGYTNQSNMQKMYEVFKAAIAPLAAIGPFYISPGNHEMSATCGSFTAQDLSCTPSFDTFAMFNQEFPGQPQNGPPGYVGTCFSFDYGNTHIASVDTCHVDPQSTNPSWDMFDLSDAEIAWLDADLASAQQAHFRHLFVFGHGQAWSADGVRWSSAASGTQKDLYDADAGVAVGASGTILTSEDGSTWTLQTSGTTVSLRAVVTGTPIVAVGDSGTILTSANSGKTWTPAVSHTTAQLNGIALIAFANPPTYLAVGASGTILTSTDGSTWTAATSPTTQDLYGVGGGRMGSQDVAVAVGKGGTLLSTTDGSTWTARTSGTTQDLHAVAKGWASGGSVLSVVGSAGTIVGSHDGVTWTPRTSGVTSDLNAVVNWDFRFIALGEGGTVLISDDGVEWEKQVSGTSSNIYGAAVSDLGELAESKYFGAGAAGTIIFSPEWIGPSSLATYRSQRDAFWQVLKNRAVDAYICGHVHIFDDGFVQDGIVQWLNGNSGSTGLGKGRWTLWNIDGDTATAQLLDESGNVTYTRVIQSSQP